MKHLLKLHLDNLAREKPALLVRNETDATIYVYDVISSDFGVSAMSVIEAIPSKPSRWVSGMISWLITNSIAPAAKAKPMG